MGFSTLKAFFLCTLSLNLESSPAYVHRLREDAQIAFQGCSQEQTCTLLELLTETKVSLARDTQCPATAGEGWPHSGLPSTSLGAMAASETQLRNDRAAHCFSQDTPGDFIGTLSSASSPRRNTSSKLQASLANIGLLSLCPSFLNCWTTRVCYSLTRGIFGFPVT